MRSIQHSIRRVLVGAIALGLGISACKETVTEPISVAAVVVNGGGGSLRLGQSVQLSTTLKSTEGWTLPNVGVSWASSDAAKASISVSGQVTAVSRGPVTLTASAGGVNGTAAVTVIGVQSISLAPETLSVIVTQTRAMTATTVLDPGVTVTPVWRSLDTTIARVDTAGRVTARTTTGFVRVEVTAEDKKDTAVVRVVPVPVVSVSVSPDTATRTVGQTLQLTATPKDSIGGSLTGRVVTWSSSDTSKVTVSGAGVAMAKAAGSATITATSEGKAGTATITVLVPVATVSVSPSTASVVVGGTQQLTATLKDAGGTVLTGRTVTWSSSNTSAATVSSTGLVTAVAAGLSTITANSEGKSSSVVLTVTRSANTIISNYPFDGSLANLGEIGPAVAAFTPTYVADRFARAGQAIELKFSSVTGQQNLSLGELRHSGAVTIATWLKIPSASLVSMTMLIAHQPGAGVALQIHQCGLFNTKCKTEGTGYLGVASNWTSDNLSSSANRLVDTTTAIKAGEWYHLALTMDSEGTATLYVNGKAVAARAGMSVPAFTTTSAIIGPCEGVPCTAHLDDFRIIAGAGSASAIAEWANDRPAPVATVTINPSITTLTIGATQQLTATLKDSAGGILTGRTVAWSSSDTTKATVSNTGLVTARATGGVTITAASEGKSGTSVITVQATPIPQNRSIVYNSQNFNVVRVTTTGTSSGSLSSGVHPIQVNDRLIFRGGFGDNKIYSSALSGSSKTVLINAFSFSPDLTAGGTRLTFFDGDCGGNAHTVAVANADGTNTQRLANICAITPPRWSPDNSAIAYQTEQGIEIYTLATGAKRSVISLSGNQEVSGWRWYGNVSWSADGGRLSFAARTSITNQYCLFTVSVNGTGLEKLPATCTTDIGYHDWDWETGTFVLEMNSGATSSLSMFAQTGSQIGAISNTTGATWPRWTRSAATVPIAEVKLTPATTSIIVGATQQLTATLKDVAGNTLTGRTVTWTTSNADIATVSTTGLVTAKAAGSITITAESNGITATSEITVAKIEFSPLNGTLAVGNHSCVVDAQGRALCWGLNAEGQLGDGSTTNRSTPTPVFSPVRFRAIAVAQRFTCGIATDSLAYCWGANTEGQLGTGLSGSSTLPVAVSGGHRFVSIVGTGRQMCALTADGSGYCWGHNPLGEVGDGTTTRRPVPTLVLTSEKFRTLHAADFVTCGLTQSGTVLCWGDGQEGRTGTNASTILTTPAAVSGSRVYEALNTSGQSSCALLVTGGIDCWGVNRSGEFSGSLVNVWVPTATTFSGIALRSVSTGIGFGCGLVAGGTAYCWGTRPLSLGTGATSSTFSPPSTLSLPEPATRIVAGSESACAITISGRLFCWGENTYGQVGDGTTLNRGTPREVGMGIVIKP